MAPSSRLLPRQFGPGGDGFDGRDDNSDGLSRTAIGGIVIGVGVIIVIVACVIWVRAMRRRKARRRTGGQSVPLHNRPGALSGPNLTPSPYSNKPTGYQSTPDQNQSLLGNAATPGGTAWDADHVGVGSTQDGFGFTTANITRPASIANFDVPPPRYEEAAAHGPLIVASPPADPARPAGEAASYYNATRGDDGERGRSATRESSGRGRALSADNRSTNADRRRSVSRFREEDMDNVNLRPNRKS